MIDGLPNLEWINASGRAQEDGSYIYALTFKNNEKEEIISLTFEFGFYLIGRDLPIELNRNIRGVDSDTVGPRSVYRTGLSMSARPQDIMDVTSHIPPDVFPPQYRGRDDVYFIWRVAAVEYLHRGRIGDKIGDSDGVPWSGMIFANEEEHPLSIASKSKASGFNKGGGNPVAGCCGCLVLLVVIGVIIAMFFK